MFEKLAADMDRALSVLDALHDGATAASAANELNSRGVPTAQGKDWTAEHVTVYRNRNLKGVAGKDFHRLREISDEFNEALGA